MFNAYVNKFSKCALITPSVLHLDSEETIVIDGHNKASEAEVEIQDFTNRGLSLAKQKVSLNKDNQFLSTATVKIPSKNLAKDPKSKQYVYVTVKSPVCNLEKVVPLSYQSGYVFIQTDKPMYTPGSTVKYKIFFMNNKMSSVNNIMITEFLNPENVIVKREKVRTEEDSGIISSSHNLTDPVSPGVWTISAKYEDSPEQNYSAHFEVKEYVLPTFEVQLIPEKKYFHVDDPEFSVDIKANYHFGKPVNGMAFGIFGVKKDDVRTSLPDTLRQIPIEDGLGHVVLRREDLVKSFSNEDDMLQHSLYMSATITTDSGRETVENKLEDIYIVRSPYKVLFTKTSKYFKVGMPLDLLLRTSHPALPPTRQATMTANANQSDGNYLHIGISATEVKPGDDLAVNFNIPNTSMADENQIQHITYLIKSKGRIQKVGRQPRQQGQKLVTMNLPIREEFLPSFRIVGYYIAGNEIVSDSMLVDVTDLSMETRSVTGKTEQGNKVQSPGSTMKLQPQADHKAKVALMAIDKRVNSEFKISQKKVRDSVEKSDLGCSPESGADSMGVFYDAGLALQTSFQTTTHQRSGDGSLRMSLRKQCEVHGTRRRRFSVHLTAKETIQEPPASRRRRASTQLVGMRTTNGIYVSETYNIPVMKDFFIDLRLPYSVVRDKQVEIRAVMYNYGSDKIKPEGIRINKIVKQMTLDPQAKGKDGVQEEAVYSLDLKDILPRTNFEIIVTYKGPPASRKPRFYTTGRKENYKWVNKKKAPYGIHVSKPYNIPVMKNFFIDLRMPYSVVRDKQVEIRAVIYNYGSDKIKPEGIRINKMVKEVTLDPQAKGKDGVQEEAVYPLDVKDIIPRTDFEIIVTYQVFDETYKSLMFSQQQLVK
ncbi:A.superbus venom factor 1-like [Leptodactylus fuscus]|uniref:A.superbus venom factor 1-like n=1 Tax=Leptodactylus fuscus TaxID=238119 RepID=UPI003F4EBCBA